MIKAYNWNIEEMKNIFIVFLLICLCFSVFLSKTKEIRYNKEREQFKQEIQKYEEDIKNIEEDRQKIMKQIDTIYINIGKNESIHEKVYNDVLDNSSDEDVKFFSEYIKRYNSTHIIK